MTETNGPPRRPLRLWPGVVAVTLQWLIRFVLPVVRPDLTMIALLSGIACGAAVLVWWLFFSRARWIERLGAIALMPLAVFATSFVVDRSIANGMMGMMLPIYSIPFLSLALVAWALAGQRLSTGARAVSLVAAVVMACGVFTVVRTGGIKGDGGSDLHWRWTPTPEERLLARAADEPVAVPVNPKTAVAPMGDEPSAPVEPPSLATPRANSAPAPAERALPAPTAAPVPLAPAAFWPGFRGAGRDSVIRGVKINTDWTQSPPVQLWRRPIGPGWSSFAVRGDLLYTQEQRGDDEIVACYRVSTGEPVWTHRDAVRFWESNGGAGPRATPTLSGGRVFTFGATGLLNALDARTGAVAWSRNAASDTNTNTPGWGFASSPLVVSDLVIVATSGKLAAYDARTGQPRWMGEAHGGGYSSPQLVTIDGVQQIVLLSGGGAASVAPADGTLLWEYSWQDGVGIIQPAVAAGGDLLITAGDAMGGVGMRRIAPTHAAAAWTVEERWTSRGLKPYFNDFVVHNGHAFGFDGSILACIDVADGSRRWKGGRYGNGQLLLLPDDDLLLVLSEEGELALVKATPDQFTEVARFKAIEGKTWNHPVLVGDVLLVRNGEEMAAFRLALAGR